MPYTSNQWLARMKSRGDMCGSVTHFTRAATIGETSKSGMEILLKILSDRCIRGSTTASGFIVGNTPAVCFQDAPIYSLCQNVEQEYDIVSDKPKGKHRYEGYGLMFMKPYVFRAGGRPVLYENTEVAKSLLPENQWWRIVSFDLSNQTHYVDWTHEREWRLPGDFRFDLDRATVLLPNYRAYKTFFQLSEKLPDDVAKNVKCIITLAGVYV